MVTTLVSSAPSLRVGLGAPSKVKGFLRSVAWSAVVQKDAECRNHPNQRGCGEMEEEMAQPPADLGLVNSSG